MLDELDSLIGKGNATELGDFLFKSGSRERADLYTTREIMELVSKDDKMKQQATGQALSAMYARINTPFGFRVVTALPDWHARLFRGQRARKHLNPLNAVRDPAGLSGAATGLGVQQQTKEDEQP